MTASEVMRVAVSAAVESVDEAARLTDTPELPEEILPAESG